MVKKRSHILKQTCSFVTTRHERVNQQITINTWLKILHLLINVKCAISCLRKFLAAESPLKMMKNAFYFTSKALFVLKIFTFPSWLFGHLAKRLDKKDKVNFKFYAVTAWLTNNRHTLITPIFREVKAIRQWSLVS